MGTLMLTGIISAIFASDPTVVFGSYDLAFANHNTDLFLTVRGVHKFYTNAIIALILVYVFAPIYHHFIAKDITILNMAKFWTTKYSKS
jgi:cytochrome b561